MDATQLDFDDATFDHVFCVEAAFHFRTRARFLREAYRVLKPGGTLVLTDMLFGKGATERSAVLHPGNYVAGPSAYRLVLEGAGYEDVRVVDATEACFLRSHRHFLGYAIGKFLHDEIDPKTFKGVLANRLGLLMSLRYYTLAAGRKPGGGMHDATAAGPRRPRWWEVPMQTDVKARGEKNRGLRRQAIARLILSSVARRQGGLHRELALLLDKEAEALEALDRDAPRTAAGKPAPAGALNREQVEMARQEALAHKDLALRSDARSLQHKVLAVLDLREGQPGGGRRVRSRKSAK